MMKFFIGLCLFLACLKNANSLILQPVDKSLNEWNRKSKVDPLKYIKFRVELFQRNLDVLEKSFWAVSDPTDRSFRKYFNVNAITELIAPSDESISLAKSWLQCKDFVPFSSQYRGIRDGIDGPLCEQTIHRDYIYITMTAQNAEGLFGINLFEYELATYKIVRAEVDSKELIPDHLRDVIARVTGLNDFPPLDQIDYHRPKASTFETSKEPGDPITPKHIWRTYGVEELLPLEDLMKLGNMSCAEFQDEGFLQTDLTKFGGYWDLTAVEANIIGHNPNASVAYYGEGSLDTEYMMATAPGIDLTWWGISWGSSFTSDLFRWTQEVISSPSPPLVHEVSWGITESGTTSFDMTTVSNTNTNFMIMGLMGLTVLVASGDDGTSAVNGLCKKFDPTFPASSPYVTAVGGTYLSNGIEIGWNHSGGGFSNVWARPSYQDDAVQSYLSQEGLPESSVYNGEGRAIPDISAFATNFQAVAKGANYTVSGTSASAPVLGGLMALLNSALLSEGKPPLGFINPSLYKLFSKSSPGVDVTEGNNLHKPCASGFPAKAGWDAVTGLGTPLWKTISKLLDPVAALQ